MSRFATAKAKTKGPIPAHLIPSQNPTHAPDLLWLVQGSALGPLGLAAQLGWISSELAKDCIGVLHCQSSVPASPFLLQSLPLLSALDPQQKILAVQPFPQRQWLLCRPGGGFNSWQQAKNQRLPWPDASWPDVHRFQLMCDTLRLAALDGAGDKVILPYLPDETLSSESDQVTKQLTDALFTGLIDWLLLPAVTALPYVEQLQLELVADVSDINPLQQPATLQVITVPQAFWRFQPKLVQKLLTILQKVDSWAVSHPEATLSYLSETTGITEELLPVLYREDLTRWFRLTQSNRALQHIRQLSELAYQLQCLPSLPNWRQSLLPIGWDLSHV